MASTTPAATAAPPTQPSPDAAWQALAQGNARFVTGEPAHPGQDSTRRAQIRDGQTPFALIFGCSDSRVAAEIVFDQGLGDLFVVRTAGHVIDAGVLGSAEYGVHVLGIPLIVVLGHDKCGAVAAAAETVRTGTAPPGYIRDVVERITPSVLAVQRAHQASNQDEGEASIYEIEAEHVRGTARLLVEKSRIINDAVDSGDCRVVGATYQLHDGHVRLVDS